MMEFDFPQPLQIVNELLLVALYHHQRPPTIQNSENHVERAQVWSFIEPCSYSYTEGVITATKSSTLMMQRHQVAEAKPMILKRIV